jgi:hypothetical protein
MNPECTVMLSPLLFRVDKSDPWISELSNGSGMWAADIGHSRGSRHFPPAGADYTLEGRNALHSTPASALLQQICASATITTTAHSATHHIPNAHQRATRDVTTHPFLAQQHHSAALPIASRQPLVLPAHLKPLSCAHSSALLLRSPRTLRQPRPQLLQEMLPTS